MSEANRKLPIVLSQEELWFLLRRTPLRFEAAGPFGLGRPPWEEEGAPCTERILLDAAGRALLARQWITFADGEARIDDTLLHIVTTAALFQQAVLFLWSERGELREHYFYAVPRLTIQHVPSRWGTHTFTESDFSEVEALGAEFLDSLQIPPLAEEPERYAFSIQALARQLKAAAEQPDLPAFFTRLLEAAEMPEETAQALQTLLLQAEHRLNLNFIYRRKPLERQSLTFVADEKALWVFQEDLQGEDDLQVQVQRVDTEGARQMIAQACARLHPGESGEEAHDVHP